MYRRRKAAWCSLLRSPLTWDWAYWSLLSVRPRLTSFDQAHRTFDV